MPRFSSRPQAILGWDWLDRTSIRPFRMGVWRKATGERDSRGILTQGRNNGPRRSSYKVVICAPACESRRLIDQTLAAYSTGDFIEPQTCLIAPISVAARFWADSR